MSAVDLAAHLWLLLAALGLNLTVGYAGAPVLGQGAFVAAGAYGTVLLADRAGWPQGLAVAAAVAATGVAGWLLGHGSARLRGAYLALATWAFAWLAYAVLVAFPDTFGGAQGLVRPPARLVSRFLGLDWRLTPAWHVVLAAALCLLVLAATRFVATGPVGLDLAAVRESEVAASSLGVPVASLRRGCLAASAAVGALAGAGSVLLTGLVAPADVSPLLSVQLYAAVLLGGAASLLGPVVGVALLAALPTVADALAEAAGVPAERSRGVVTAALLLLALAVRGRVRLPSRARAADLPDPEPLSREPAAVEAVGVVKAFGAVRALDGVAVDVRPGEVHALVGPNGSGKTTLLRVLAGTLPLDAGTVTVGGRDVTGADERGRVRAGIARTFQRTVLFPGLPVAAQVAAGARVTESAGLLRPLLRTPSWQAGRRRAAAATAALLRDCGLDPDAAPATLPYGEQRLLQVARAAATGARVLLLDEPAAGMSQAERLRLVHVVRGLAGTGVGVLLVEHDMRLVGAVADRVTVLAEGRVLASGDPVSVRADPAVRAAYLGAPA